MKSISNLVKFIQEYIFRELLRLKPSDIYREVIDRKYQIIAINPCKPNGVYTERDGVFFSAKDAALPAALRTYLAECEKLGCEQEHLDSIGLLMQRIDVRQKHELKIPDTNTDCEIDRCIGGNNV